MLSLFINPNKKEIIIDDNLQGVVDSLLIENKKLEDSIRITDTIIVTINKEYEKKVVTVITQSVSDDIEFFSKYLSESDKRFSNSSNCETIEND